MAVCLFTLLSGCVNKKCFLLGQSGFQKAHRHARRALREAGFDISPHCPNYELEIFWRVDRRDSPFRYYVLYDFLKVSAKPGPDRFVIASDMVTHKTYLRADVRSNENLDALPLAESPASVD